jgi:anthranilate synthase/aminodeoxychorismate synthase-like glutamine amidotransferase
MSDSTLDILFIDNFDSFSFNLVDEFARRGANVEVYRNDLSIERAVGLVDELKRPGLLVLSPGPGAPADAGCCVELVRQVSDKIPIFGVCLGHQVLVEAFGGTVGRSGQVFHGKASELVHDKSGLFDGLDSPFKVGRYHSLVAHELPDELQPTAHIGEMVMAVEHRDLPVFGVQFHPESILTPQGGRLIDNLLVQSAQPRGKR